MSELEQVSESPVPRSLGQRSALAASEWRETSFIGGLEGLFREIGTYLEFVAIARGR
jgi:hypothetical protein